MKISEMVSKLLGLEQSVFNLTADKSKATDSALTNLAAEVASIKTGALAELDAAHTVHAATVTILTAKADKAEGELTAVNGLLKAACTSMNLTVKDGATNAEIITAMQDGVASTLAKLNVKAEAIPAAAANANGNQAKKMTLDEEVAARRAQITATK